MEHITKSDYTGIAVEAAYSVLLELFGILGEFREHLVIVGGWVPPLLFQNAETTPIRTLDVDIAMDFLHISSDTYRTLLRTLETHGYRQDRNQPFRFFKTVTLGGAPSIVVEVDLLAGEYGGTGNQRRTQAVQDARARKARGADLVFKNCVRVPIEGRLPDGRRDAATVKVAATTVFLVMKGMALYERGKAKDCYDIFYCISSYPGGIQALAEAFAPLLSNRLVVEGLGKIRAKFLSPEHVGPIGVADFLEITDPEEREIRVRDVYERVNALLDSLNISPWEDGQEL